MKIRPLLFGFAIALFFPAGALALEVTPAIKVMPLVKSTTSWNGVPIVYPQ